LMINKKSPKVIKVIGKAMNSNIGRTIPLRSESTKATTRAVKKFSI